MDTLSAELRGEMAEMRGAVVGLGRHVDAEIARALDRMRVWMISTMLAFVVGLGGLLLAMAQLHR